MSVELWLSIISLIFVTALGFLQWRTQAKKARSAEALDWSETAKNLRAEIGELRDEIKEQRDEIKGLRDENKILKELARRLIKNPPEKGDVVILSPVEHSLLFDTGSRFKKP